MKDASVLTDVPGRKPSDRPPVDRGVAIGDVLGKCLITDLIGRGATCTVYRALHQGLNVPVALKVLQLGTGESHRRAYEQLKFEARLLAQMPHPHIVRVYDFEDDLALPYLVLECVEGPSLDDLIHQSGRLALDRACEIIGQIAEALGALWKMGAVHRDVKPGNILLDRNGVAKLADFGQAVLVEEQEIAGFDAAPGHDEVSGTAAYLAPEQFLSPSTVDHRSDIYALGASFYQAVVGQLPFTGRSRMQMLLKRTREQPVPPHERAPGLSREVSDVILGMMARDPMARYQDLEEVRDALIRLGGATVPLVAVPEVAAVPETPAVQVLPPPPQVEQTSAEEVEPPPPCEDEEPPPCEDERAESEDIPVEDDAEPEDEFEDAPPRRSFWKTLLPKRGSPAAAPAAATAPVRNGNQEWLRFVKRTLTASANRKREE